MVSKAYHVQKRFCTSGDLVLLYIVLEKTFHCLTSIFTLLFSTLIIELGLILKVLVTVSRLEKREKECGMYELSEGKYKRGCIYEGYEDVVYVVNYLLNKSLFESDLRWSKLLSRYG